MKNLLERLDPQVKEELLKDKDKFPFRHKYLVETLSNLDMVQDIPVGVANNLVYIYTRLTDTLVRDFGYIITLYKIFGK